MTRISRLAAKILSIAMIALLALGGSPTAYAASVRQADTEQVSEVNFSETSERKIFTFLLIVKSLPRRPNHWSIFIQLPNSFDDGDEPVENPSDDEDLPRPIIIDTSDWSFDSIITVHNGKEHAVEVVGVPQTSSLSDQATSNSIVSDSLINSDDDLEVDSEILPKEDDIIVDEDVVPKDGTAIAKNTELR